MTANPDRSLTVREVEDFIRVFIDAENRALRSSFEEEDDARATDLLRTAQAMLASGAILHFGRPLGLSPELRAAKRRKAAQFVPRTLFAIRRFADPRFGEVAQAIVSWDQAYGQRRYYDSFVIARIDGDLRIVARYGLVDDQAAVRWKRETGADLGPFGAAIETARFEPPDDPVHHRDWERDT